MDLSLNLQGLVAQQLVPSLDGKYRRACVEVLLNTPLASDLIRKGKVDELKPLMKKSGNWVQTFDDDLYQLYNAGEISYDNALSHADSSNDLRLLIKLQSELDTDSLSLAVEEIEIKK